MNRFNELLRWSWSVLLVCVLAFALGGCEGDDGTDGANGANGADGADGLPGTPAPVPDPIQAAIDSAQVESCATCHGGVGDGHQALYNKYTDGSADAGTNLVMTFGDFSVAGAGPFDVELDFTVTQNGLPLESFTVLGLNRFYVTRWDPDLEQYLEGTRIRTVTGANGAFTVAGSLSFDPTTNASFYGYIGDEQVIIDDVNYDAHMGLYDNLISAGMETAGAGVYTSAAVVSGCESCHGTPYMKHGNRAAAVEGLPDFASCKGCHYDDREGGHGAWQYMVDDPLGWATDVLPDEDAVNAAYPYTANVMNDTHMSHAMEFPYPQSMANCATCHAGNVDVVLADELSQRPILAGVGIADRHLAEKGPEISGRLPGVQERDARAKAAGEERGIVDRGARALGEVDGDQDLLDVQHLSSLPEAHPAWRKPPNRAVHAPCRR